MTPTPKTIEQLSALAQEIRFAVFQALMWAGAIASALGAAPVVSAAFKRWWTKVMPLRH